MPKSAEPAPDYVPADKKPQWEAVYKSAFAKAKEDGKSDKEAEQTAFAEANGVIKKESKSMPVKREVRFLQGAEMRATDTPDGPRITGYAATFDEPYTIPGIFGDFTEQVRKGAFTRALSEGQDVRALFNHDPSRILGRTSNGTVTLSEDERGLRYEIIPNLETQDGRDLVALVKRGDISQSSFGFSVHRNGNVRGEEWLESDGIDSRILTDLDLYDVSPVTFPANGATSVSVRSLWPDGVPEEIEARAAVTKKEEDGEHPSSHYLVVEDPKEPSTWHLRVKDVDGKPDHRLMGAAWAALHEGYRGNKYDGPQKQEAIAKLEALYKSEGLDLPSEANSLRDENDVLREENRQLKEFVRNLK